MQPMMQDKKHEDGKAGGMRTMKMMDRCAAMMESAQDATAKEKPKK